MHRTSGTITILAFVFLIILSSSTAVFSDDNKSLSAKWRSWLNEYVVYIISEREKAIFLQLQTDKQRELFEREFWVTRDPTPGTEKNERKEEHDQRVEYANKFLGRDTPRKGWQTDRGKYYIILGKPKQIDRYPSGGQIYPLELWFFQAEHGKGLSPFFYLMFFQRNGSGEYILYNPVMDGPQALTTSLSTRSNSSAYESLLQVNPELANAAFSYLPDESGRSFTRPSLSSITLLTKIENIKNIDINPSYAERILLGEENISTSYTFSGLEPAHEIFPAVHESGISIIYYAIQLPPELINVGQYKDTIYGSLEFETRLADQNGTSIQEKTDKVELDLTPDEFDKIKYSPLLFQNQLISLPGKHLLTIKIKNPLTKEYYLITKDVVVPGRNSTTASAGELQLCAGAEKLPEIGQARSNPFQFGAYQLNVAPNRRFNNTTPLFMYCQIFVPSELRQAGKTFDISFGMLQEDGTVLGTTKKTLLCSQVNRNGIFQLASTFPVSNLSPGKYTQVLNIDFGDDLQRLIRTAHFEITGNPVPQLNVFTGKAIDLSSGEVDLEIGRMWLESGNKQLAEEYLLQAVNKNPKSLEKRMALATLLQEAEKYRQAVNLLQPILVEEPLNHDLIMLIANNYYKLEEYSKAIKYLERLQLVGKEDTQSLNLLAEAHLKLGNTEKAQEYWRLSLSKDPGQKEIQQKLESIEHPH